MTQKSKLVIDTPGGRLSAKASPDPVYPGIWISIDDDNFVLVEYHPKEKKIITKVWAADCNCDPVESIERDICPTCLIMEG